MALYLKRICYNLDSELNKFEFGGIKIWLIHIR